MRSCAVSHPTPRQSATPPKSLLHDCLSTDALPWCTRLKPRLEILLAVLSAGPNGPASETANNFRESGFRRAIRRGSPQGMALARCDGRFRITSLLTPSLPREFQECKYVIRQTYRTVLYQFAQCSRSRSDSRRSAHTMPRRRDEASPCRPVRRPTRPRSNSTERLK